jgi:hypothetical protein
MRDIGGSYENGERAREGLVALALQAVERLAARRLEGVGVLKQDLLDRIVELATSPEQGAAPAMMGAFQQARVPAPQIADLYLPSAARAFGDAWMEDRLSFSQVTVGVARLQEVLHLLDLDREARLPAATGVDSALVMVPPGEQHTFGALLLTLDLRRRGLSVSMQFAPAMSDLSRLLADRPFDVAFLSLGSTERLETCVKLVKTLKRLSRGRMRVAVGGAAIESCREALASGGADLVTNDVESVLADAARHAALEARDGG